MADISIATPGALESAWPRSDQEAVLTSENPTCTSWLTGKVGTFCIVRDGVDSAVAAGYLCHPDADSMQQTLHQILSSFDESHILHLKRTLIGQYVILVKKGAYLYLFTDFIGGRNLFYTEGALCVSSSFALAETLTGTARDDLDPYKVLEFVAMKELLYAAWLGRGTCHRRIKWLRPYEYLVVHTESGALSVRSLQFAIDNRKAFDCGRLGDELRAILSTIIARPEFQNSPVAATITGGQDSRLVAAIAARQYRNIHYRIACADGQPRTFKDLAVARKVARIRNIPLRVHRFVAKEHEEKFCELTEGLTPCFNNAITPLLMDAASYSLGFGGVFGTELFMPLPWHSINDFVKASIDKVRRTIEGDGALWDTFEGTIRGEIEALKEHYLLTDNNDVDYIRLFLLLDTARYGSFILSAFNRSGYQLDPYGTYNALELALRIPPALWGDHRRLGGMSPVQKAAMAKVDRSMGRVLTFMHYRPMLPLSARTYPLYAGGYALQGAHWLWDKLRARGGTNPVYARREMRSCELSGGTYTSDGWEKPFVERCRQRYGLNASIETTPIPS